MSLPKKLNPDNLKDTLVEIRYAQGISQELMFSNVSSYKIRDDFKKSLENILSILPEIISVGVSDDECVYIYFEKDNKSVYFDLFFEPEQKTEASITVFENKVSKLSFTDYLDNSIHKIRNEFITEK